MNVEHGPKITFLDDIPSARADVRFTRETIRRARTPGVYFVGDAYRYVDAITVDTSLLRQQLLASGFSRDDARSVAVIFRTPQSYFRDMHVEGWFANNPCLDETLKNPRSNNFGVSVMLGVNDGALPHTLWHEVGHAHKARVLKDETPMLYSDEYRQFAKLSVAMQSMGPIRRRIAQVEQRRLLRIIKELWLADLNEQYAEAFAHKLAPVNPVTFDPSRVMDSLPEGLDPKLIADPELRNIKDVYNRAA